MELRFIEEFTISCSRVEEQNGIGPLYQIGQGAIDSRSIRSKRARVGDKVCVGFYLQVISGNDGRVKGLYDIVHV